MRPTVVDQAVARNPVARAVARRRVETSVRDFIIRLYTLDDGDDITADAFAAATVLAVAIHILENRGHGTDPDAYVMAETMGALIAVTETGWQRRAAATLDDGLQRAVQIINQATAQETQRAWVHVEGVQEFHQQ